MVRLLHLIGLPDAIHRSDNAKDRKYPQNNFQYDLYVVHIFGISFLK